MSDPTTPEGRTELRELARKAKAASFEPGWPYDGTGNWTACVDALLGGITGQFAGAMSPDVVIALLDTLDRQERELNDRRAYQGMQKLVIRAEKAESAVNKARKVAYRYATTRPQWDRLPYISEDQARGMNVVGDSILRALESDS